MSTDRTEAVPHLDPGVEALCVFCGIAAGRAEASVVHEDETVPSTVERARPRLDEEARAIRLAVEGSG